MENRTPQVAVVGGGAAGLFAAISSARSGAPTVIYEKNSKTGRKLRITGKGKCNVTNDCAPDEFLKNVLRNPKFLFGALNRLSPRDTEEFFESLGVPLKTERGRRVFPLSDRAADIADALETEARRLGVRIKRLTVTDVRAENGSVTGVVTEDGAFHPHSEVIVATGGLSYPLTGSTGDGLRFAEKLGIETVPVKGSLVPIETCENFSDLSGLSLKNVTLTVKNNESGKTVFSELGEMLFCHFGVSGPLVLSASCHMAKKEASLFSMEIDLKPGLTEEELDRRLLSDLAKYSQKDLINSLGDLLPQKLIALTVERSGIPPHTKSGGLTRAMRRDLLTVLKHFTVTPKRARPIAEAIVTCGGVSVKEVSPKTMECKRISGIYFAGEILDVDAYTGGYNLQIAFSTGHLAGTSAAERRLSEEF